MASDRKVVGGIWMVSPGGHRVRVFRHGYVEFGEGLTDDQKLMIQDCVGIARENFPKVTKPREIFELMGWKREEKTDGE